MASSSKKKYNLAERILFINETGHCMHFILLMEDLKERDSLKESIEAHLGAVSNDIKDIGPYSLVLADIRHSDWKHNKVEKFRIGYVDDCLQQNKLLDINSYKWSLSYNYKNNFDYMDIVFLRRYSWDTIPERKPRKSNDSDSDGDVVMIESDVDTIPAVLPSTSAVKPESPLDSDPDSDDSFMRTEPEPKPKKRNVDKNTRLPYSKKEREAIVNYIVERKLYDMVKGVTIWKDFERMNKCPNRTWQSMKEHALKMIPKNITAFSSLTPKQRERLYKALTGKEYKKNYR